MIIVPALAATVLARPDTTDAPAKVTRVLESIPQSPRPSSRATRTPSDAPVTASTAGGNVAITFERGRRVPLGHIEIPAIDLRTRFYDGVVDESVELGPGHWPGTPWPGEPGNSVFAGHRTTFTRPFADLDLLNEGQRVTAQVRNGPKTTYRIVRTTVVSEAEYVDFVLKQPRNESVRMITLFACTPKGSRTHRIVVQATAFPAPNRKHSDEDEEGR